MMKSAEILSKQCLACPTELCGIRHDVTSACKQMGFKEDDINAVVLAIDEACTNIIRYAYKDCSDGTILLEISKADNQAIFRLYDHAPKSPKDCIKPKKTDPLKPGGLGVVLMHKVMDSVNFIDTEECQENILEMRKDLPLGKTTK